MPASPPRPFSNTPQRDANHTWTAIVDLLTQGNTGAARSDLLAVSGVAASVIADQAPKDAPIVVTCDGPRTRIYCLYDDDALDGADANEDLLGFDPLKGEWRLSLPCLSEDLAWVQGALKRHSRSEEHTSELQSLMRISYAVFCLKKKQKRYRQK